MWKHLIATALLCAGGLASAAIPTTNFTCPGNLEVHADQGGPVHINGKETRLKVIDVMTAAAGTGVTVSVPGADAPWSCLVDKRGRVQNAMYTGKEGGR